MNWRRTGCLAAVVACFLWAMGMISACAVGSQGPKGKELLEAEYDRIIWHNGGLIEAVKQENRWWYLLTGDDMTELSVPNGVRPWKREDESIWASDSEGRTGLMDFNGCILLPCRYERIETYLGGKILESYERTETGMERCLWDREGNPIYRISIQDGNDIKVVSENAFLVQQNFEYFLIDGQGRRILPGTYSYGKTWEESGYAALGDMSYVGKPGYKKIYRADGTLAAEGNFEFVEFTGQEDYPFLARRSENESFYLMTAEGKPILTDYAVAEEEWLYPLSKTLFRYRKGDVQSILDADGHILHTSSYGPDANGTYPIGWMNLEEDGYGLFYGDNRWIIINAEGREWMEEETQKADLILYCGGSLIAAYDGDSCRIYNLEGGTCIYEGGQEASPSILTDYFVLTEKEQQRIFDRNGREITGLPGTVKRVYEAGHRAAAIVEENGKQGLYVIAEASYNKENQRGF